MIGELNKTNLQRLYFYLLPIFLAICGGGGIVFHFKRELFLRLDVVKLLILCSIYSGPYLFPAAILTIFLAEPKDNERRKSNYERMMIFSCASASATIFIALAIAYWLQWEFRPFVVCSAVIMLIFAILVLVAVRTDNSSKA